MERVQAHPVGIGLRVLSTSGSTGTLKVEAAEGVGWIDVVNGAVSSVRCPAAAAGSLLEQIVEMLTWTDGTAEVIAPRVTSSSLGINVDDLLVRADLALRSWETDRSDFHAGGRRLHAEQADVLGGARRFGASVSEGRDWAVLAAIAGGADELGEVACQLRRGRAEVARSVRRLVAQGRVRVRSSHPAHGRVRSGRVVDAAERAGTIRTIRTSTRDDKVELPSNVVELAAVRERKEAAGSRLRRSAFGRN